LTLKTGKLDAKVLAKCSGARCAAKTSGKPYKVLTPVSTALIPAEEEKARASTSRAVNIERQNRKRPSGHTRQNEK
jgi:hypothetical protein